MRKVLDPSTRNQRNKQDVKYTMCLAGKTSRNLYCTIYISFQGFIGYKINSYQCIRFFPINEVLAESIKLVLN